MSTTKQHKHGGNRIRPDIIDEIHNEWCRDNGYPIKHKYHESRKAARERWRKSEHGKKWTQDYMREYRSRPHVRERYHIYYVNNKLNWGRIKEAKAHERANIQGINLKIYQPNGRCAVKD